MFRPCTTSVEILTQTSISVNGKAYICTEEFWTPLRTLIRRRLNGRIRMLHLAHAPGESANISKMLHNLNDFGIEDLMIVGVHWPRVQKKHLRQMSDLKVVNLSGSGISSIDNGKQRSDHNLTDAQIYLAGDHCQFRMNFKKTFWNYFFFHTNVSLSE